MALERNTRDLGSFGEETEQDYNSKPNLMKKIAIVARDGVTITCNGVGTCKGRRRNSDDGVRSNRLKEALEDMAGRQHWSRTYPNPTFYPFEELLNDIMNPPDELVMDDSESDIESYETPLVSPFLNSDDESDNGEVINELNEYGNA
ncbi:hypothetical protein Tco_0417863 [Tanacetum coccineum]